jgi:hypothetical protein
MRPMHGVLEGSSGALEQVSRMEFWHVLELVFYLLICLYHEELHLSISEQQGTFERRYHLVHV